MSHLTPEAKAKLSATIRRLRSDMLEAIHNGVESAYRLSLPAAKAGLAEEPRIKRVRLENWLELQVRAEGAGGRGPNAAKAKQRHLHAAEKLAAATLLNRLVVIKQMEAMGLIRPMVVTGGWQSKGYKEFRESAPDLCRDETEGFGTLLKLMYDELSLEMPGLFGKVGITPLILIPPTVLRMVIEALDAPVLADAWKDDTTLGWVYQYWNDPEREALDAKLNKGGKVEPHEIASKTQMFTERYMVEWLLHNSLGQQWLAICQKNGWTPEVQADGTLERLEERRKVWRQKRERGEVALDELMPIETEQEERWKYWVPQPELDDQGVPASIRELKIFDPACGSGHFLIIAFGLLFAFYQEEARHRDVEWSDKEIVEAIAANNLHGLDLDPRAVQIAAAALYLKAKSLCPKAKLNVVNLVASNLNLAALPDDDPALVELQREVTLATGIPEDLTNRIVHGLKGADAWGSLLQVDTAVDDAIREYGRGVWRQRQTSTFDADYKPVPDDPHQSAKINLAGLTADEQQQLRESLQEKIEKFLTQRTRSDDLGLRLRGEQLAAGVRFLRLVRESSYDLVIGNPPYQGTSKMKNARYVAQHYPMAKADLYAAFLQRGLELAKPGGLSALLTMRNWMFINQFATIREFLIDTYDLRALGDFDRGAFDEVPNEVLSVVTSIFRKGSPSENFSIATQPTSLDDNSYDRQRTNRKRASVLLQIGKYKFKTNQFKIVKSSPMTYWWSVEFRQEYMLLSTLDSEASVLSGSSTGNNVRFVKFTWEVSWFEYIPCTEATQTNPTQVWQPFVNGAKGRKWIEPLLEVVNWKYWGLACRLSPASRVLNLDFNWQYGVAFVMIGAEFSARIHRFKSICGNKGSSVFPCDKSKINNLLALMNSFRSRQVMSSLNPGLGFEVGDIKRLPLFPIESADEIFAQLDRAFTEHEAARETSVEFQQPGSSCWAYAQDWAQQAVDRPADTPLPEWQPVYEPPTPQAWVSYAIGIALGRFSPHPQPLSLERGESESSPVPLLPGEKGLGDEGPETGDKGSKHESLPHGILYLSAYSGDQLDSVDSLNHPAAHPIHQAWAEHGASLTKNKPLHDWLRQNFFKDIHLKQYENRPIYFPLSSANKNFVAFINIHCWSTTTLQTLLADYLLQDLRTLEGETADLLDNIGKGDSKQQAKVEERRATVQTLYAELQTFVDLVRQCAEQGPPAADHTDPPREADAPFVMDLDDGVMVNSAALWPLLAPQWSKPQTWWSELCRAEGKKDYDWSHLAARYFPTRVDEKCQSDPSLAVAHGCFWRYHPAKAYEWELRLQDEIASDFTIDEDQSDTLRQEFEETHPDKVAELREKETKRRERKYKKQAEDQLSLEVSP